VVRERLEMAASASGSSSHREWRFSQCFGETVSQAEQTDADILSAVEFDQTGRYLATGDRGGRIVIFETDKASSGGDESKREGKKKKGTTEYRFHCEFQSHEPEFDYLKSLEIEEKINQIKWCPPCGDALYLLSTNDKTIKLWKVFDKQVKTVLQMNVKQDVYHAAETAARATNMFAVSSNAYNSLGSLSSASNPARTAALSAARNAGFTPFKSASQLVMPRFTTVESVVACQPRRTFANAHAYHINSIAVNSDGETFLSADDLRINLWHLAHSNQTFNIVDIKPENMEDLTEVITAAEFHPTHCSTFAYSNSRGAIKLGDMRASALCDRHAKVYEEEEQPGDKSFFSEIIASISDIKFANDGNYIIARDYLSLKIWDVKMENRPVKTIQIHEHLRPKLCDLYENDSIFDKFECVVSPDGKYFATGSYHNYLHVFDRTGKNDVCIEASNTQGRKTNGVKSGKLVTDPANIDFSRKIMSLSWHPEQSVIAVCGANNLYLFAK